MKNIIRKFAVLLFLVSFMVGCGKEASLSASWEDSGEQQTDQSDASDEEEAQESGETMDADAGDTESIFVQILGAVKKPGVYEVPEGSRLFQVLKLAGGFSDGACQESVNQAAVVTDEQQIYVYTEEEAETMRTKGSAVGTSETGESIENGKVNLNTAEKEQLMTLPGIGESKAESIMEYRENMGKFSSIEDIMKVDGIKEGVFNKIKEKITI